LGYTLKPLHHLALILQPHIGYQSFLTGPGALTDGLFPVKVTEIPRRWRSY